MKKHAEQQNRFLCTLNSMNVEDCTQNKVLHDVSVYMYKALYIQLPGHILRTLGTAATQETILQLHIQETMYQWLHKMADQE